MSNFYIADLHFGHANIMRHSKRPFTSVEEMDETLIKNWNKVVKPTDTVYILGDLCFKNGKNPEEYLTRLNGTKILILGNHDTQIRKNLVRGKYPELVKVVPYLELTEVVDGESRLIVLSHYPMIEWNGYFRNSIHLYGHIHNNTENDTYTLMKNRKNAYNVGVDILDYTPRTLAEVIEYNNKFFAEH